MAKQGWIEDGTRLGSETGSPKRRWEKVCLEDSCAHGEAREEEVAKNGERPFYPNKPFTDASNGNFQILIGSGKKRGFVKSFQFRKKKETGKGKRWRKRKASENKLLGVGQGGEERPSGDFSPSLIPCGGHCAGNIKEQINNYFGIKKKQDHPYSKYRESCLCREKGETPNRGGGNRRGNCQVATA